MKKILTLLVAACLSATALQAQKFALPDGYEDLRVLLIGNSFTYFHECDSMLLQIARSQGVRIRLGEFLKGGQTFGQHLNLPKTSEAIAAGHYQYAFIQDFSNNAALYVRDKEKSVLDNTCLLRDRILQASPHCQVILERTWSYEGNGAGGFASADELDGYLEQGARKLSRKSGLPLSPIGNAFNTVRAERPEINLFEPDAKHQSAEGSYLKCCVNWLMISGKPFSGTPDCCGIDPAVATYLRSVAERTVLKNGVGR